MQQLDQARMTPPPLPGSNGPSQTPPPFPGNPQP